MTIDPREVAAVTLETNSNKVGVCSICYEWLPMERFIFEFSVDRGRGRNVEAVCRGCFEAMRSADHQWLAEHAPEADQRLVDDFAYACECFGDSVNKPKAEQLEISNTIASLQTALLARLALYRPPVIDEAAVERAIEAYALAWDAKGPNARSTFYGADYEGMRAALEAFVAGGEG